MFAFMIPLIKYATFKNNLLPGEFSHAFTYISGMQTYRIFYIIYQEIIINVRPKAVGQAKYL